MDETIIPCVRELNDYHAQVKDISAYADFHAGELRVNRRDLLHMVKEAQELRCFTSIRTCYFLKLTKSNIRETAQLPFMKPNGYSIADRLVEMAGIGSVRSSINKLLKTIFSKRDELPEVLATLSFHTFPESVPYLPEGIKPADFFACSTIPSLFGHYWTTELQSNFIEFIFQVSEKIPGLSCNNFRQHWLFDCIKYYICSSGVIQFIRLSIGDLIFNIVRDQDLINMANGRPSQDLFDKLCAYARQMLINMKKNVAIFPNDVKYILKHFSNLGQSNEERLYWTELFFLECVLAPAISNPRNYGIIPPTHFLDQSQLGPFRALNYLAQIFRFILHPQQVGVRYQGVSGTTVASLPIADLLQSIVVVDELELQGPKLTDLLPLLGIHYILLLFSLPDIYLLADAFQRSQTPDAQLSRDAANIPTNEPIAFDFFRFDVWDFNIFGFKKPKIPENEIEKPPKNSASLAGEALYKFLSFAEVDKNAPNGYSDFSEFHERNMILQRQFITEAYLRHLYVIYQSVPEKDQRAVIPGLEDEIRRHLELEKRNDEILTGIAIQTRVLRDEISRYKEMFDDSMQILYAQLLAMFLSTASGNNSSALMASSINNNNNNNSNNSMMNQNNNNNGNNNNNMANANNNNLNNMAMTIQDNLSQIIKARAQEFVNQKSAFAEFYQNSINALNTIVAPIADFALSGVASCFHSYVMSIISLNEFRNNNMMLKKCDQLLKDITEQSIDQICISSSPERVRPLFNYPQLFVFSIFTSQKAAMMALPLEILRKLAQTITLILKLFELEIGGTPTPNELQCLLNFVLLKSGIPNLFSIGKYLQHFLAGIPFKLDNLFTEEMENALKMFVTHTTTLESLLSDY